ncbi:MAG: TonB-dependent receptor [Ferrovibrio sp.]|uniref:TonB-dependent receptor n=1 Tax=Ferrovibrio sp. TaxID=1917215 RepID=UPI00260E52D4|nr:TonB-dependent receptor [Ferrovibrio sp.]MCW0233308.1 TonB-dependent receptor [Ferrovibrio sp.]
MAHFVSRATRGVRYLIPLALLYAAPAWAQDTVLPTLTIGGQVPEEEAGLQLTQPAATGSRLGLTPLETPASVEVITGETIRARGYATVNEAVGQATGVSSIATPGNGGTALSTRGFTGHNSMMQLYDGTQMYVGAGTVTFPFDTWTADRIEVLRGPASVLYGAGAIGGVVNVVPKKPGATFENEALVEFGRNLERHLATGSGGPINSKLSYRADASGRKSDGWVDRDETESLAFALALRAQASENFAISLSHDYGYQRPSRYFGTPLINGSLDESIRKKNYNVENSLIEYRDNWTQLKFEWNASDSVTLNNTLYRLTTNRHWRNLETYSYNSGTGLIDRSDALEILHDQTQYGNRFDATIENSVFGLKNTSVVGLDVNRANFRYSHDFDNGAASASVDPFNPQVGLYQSDDPFRPRHQTQTRQYSLFAEDRLSVTDRWTLVGGLRFDHIVLNRDQLDNPANSFEKTFADPTWRIGTVYSLTPATSLYGQYVTAVDPVGGILNLSAANRGFTLATGRQVEVGVKQSLMNGRGEWTLAGYHIVKTDITSRVPGNPTLTQQIGEQSSRGVEFAAGFDLARDWRLEGNATWLDARFDEFTEASGASRAGNTPPNVPELLGNLWLAWAFAPEWKARAGLRYVGERYSDNANLKRLPDYTVVDLGLEWRPHKDVSIAFRLHNLFDEVYAQTAYGDDQWMLGLPRTAVVSTHVKF